MGKTRSGPVQNCIKCGTLYRAWRSDRPSKYCSRDCAPKGRQAKKASSTCRLCGVLFRRYGGGHPAQFCSRECYLLSGVKKPTPDGYVLVYAKDEPGAKPNGQILEHRLVMQQSLGRPLRADETVHHINGDRADNRIENLQLRVGRHGNGIEYTCLDCGSHNVAPTSLKERTILYSIS